jgi:hypothetical protein
MARWNERGPEILREAQNDMSVSNHQFVPLAINVFMCINIAACIILLSWFTACG